MKSRPRVAVSLGDPSGIGAEVTMKALRRSAIHRALTAVVFCDASFPAGPWERVVVSHLAAKDRRPGKPTLAGGEAQYAYFKAAVDAAKDSIVDAICTAPVAKDAIVRAGIPFVGHTEALGEFLGGEPLMVMHGPRLAVALATTHVPLRRVSEVLTSEGILRALTTLDREFPRSKGRPRIAVCGVNPHPSDGGFGGDEEQRIIAPALTDAREAGIKVFGPFAADGLFAKAAQGFPYDVALAMYHDQGLIAVKVLDFASTVNVTLGIPLPRTSPDHGVAYDIAGKGKADEKPMAAALLQAAAMVKLRRRVTSSR